MTTIQQIVGSWTRLYTAGLDPADRDARRAEITSDLWEQARALEDAGDNRMAATVAIGARWLLGIPDDLLWRAERRRASRGQGNDRERRRTMLGLGSARVLALPVIVASAAVVVAIAGVVIGNIQYFEQSERIVSNSVLEALWVVLMVGSIAGIVLGFVVMPRQPGVGAVLVVGGAATAGISTSWLIVPLVLAVVVSWYGIRRARRIASEAPSA
jgi:hypothetical protein